MSGMQVKRKIIGFRPESKEVFSTTVKHLSRLIDEGHQKTMELLSRIYGYSNWHELQKVLKKADDIPGPFDDDIENGHNNHSPFSPDILGRRDRVLRLMAEYKGVAIDDLDPKYMAAADIGLFCTAKAHRHAYRAVRDKENNGNNIADISQGSHVKEGQ